jgi:hypothetical protein
MYHRGGPWTPSKHCLDALDQVARTVDTSNFGKTRVRFHRATSSTSSFNGT